jgi:hypothetical protein
MALPPKTKKKVRRRVSQRVGQEYAPDIRQKEAERRRILRERGTEVRSLRGASRVSAEAIRHESTKGLKGRYLRQVQRELGSRSADILRSAPDLIAAAKSEYADELRNVNEDLYNLQTDRTQDISEQIKEVLQKKQEERAANQTELKAALQEARSLAKSSLGVGQELPVNSQGWYLFAKEVAKVEGVGLPAAIKATERLRRKLAKIRANRGVLGDFGHQATLFANTVRSQAGQ